MLARINSAAIVGVEAVNVEVEVDVASSGAVNFSIVGLPDAAIKESADRVKTALRNCGFPTPASPIVINLAPADLRKEGSAFDFPISIGILVANNVFQSNQFADCILAGELALDGRLRPIKGALSIARLAAQTGKKRLLIPTQNATEAALVNNINVYPVNSLPEAINFIQGELPLKPLVLDRSKAFNEASKYNLDLQEVKGQAHAKRALEVAAAGGHNLIMVGNPGSGKTMLARRLPTILPPMNFEEAIETTNVYSITGTLGSKGFTATRPFRSPHHSVSQAGLIGGGSFPTPGEVSLAHNGVLFLDEIPEFQRNVLEVLRQPMEDGNVTISRVAGTLEFPSRFMLVAAMNPCPCGFHGDPEKQCKCTPPVITRYHNKISGPLMDRIDLQVAVPSVKYKDFKSKRPEESSAEVRKRVTAARQVQIHRYSDQPFYNNAQLPQRLIDIHCIRTDEAEALLEQAYSRLKLSARAYSRILKVSRTIADLEQSRQILPLHISEAIQYRMLDRTS